MDKSKIIKIAVPALFALAILFGFLQRKHLADFLFGSNSRTLKREGSSTGSLQGFYEIGQQLRGSDNSKNTVTFLAVGDIILSRNVLAVMNQAQDSRLPFRGMETILNSTDFNFANLESPIDPYNEHGIVGGHSMIFGAPNQLVSEILPYYHFKVINLANNHAFDQGLKGLDATKQALSSVDVQTEGTGETLDEAWQPAVVTVKNLKICFVGASYASINDNGKTTNNYVARIEDIERLKASITLSKTLCDYTVATMHAGTEYTREPNSAQVAFAHAAIDDGADIVIGAHPHWVQTVEKYNGKYIFYSLGNFIFDQEWSKETTEGLALKITVSKKTLSSLQGPAIKAQLDSIELLPVTIENFSTPRLATGQESKKILQEIGQTETKITP